MKHYALKATDKGDMRGAGASLAQGTLQRHGLAERAGDSYKAGGSIAFRDLENSSLATAFRAGTRADGTGDHRWFTGRPMIAIKRCHESYSTIVGYLHPAPGQSRFMHWFLDPLDGKSRKPTTGTSTPPPLHRGGSILDTRA